MKLYHYCLVFCLFSIGTILISDMVIFERQTVSIYSENTDAVFDKAVDAAVKRLRLYSEHDSEGVRDDAVEAFYDSLYASLGIADNPDSREKVRLYVPVIIITVGDGFYVYYDDVSPGIDGTEELVRRCTEKKVYSYYENTAPEGYCATDFIYRFLGKNTCSICDTEGICGEKSGIYSVSTDENREAINKELWNCVSGGRNYSCILKNSVEFENKRLEISTSKLEDALTYYCNFHNTIAANMGISYGFSVPQQNGELYLKAIDGISFIAFFQGYPVNGSNEVFNCFSVSNARVVEK